MLRLPLHLSTEFRFEKGQPMLRITERGDVPPCRSVGRHKESSRCLVLAYGGTREVKTVQSGYGTSKALLPYVQGNYAVICSTALAHDNVCY